MQQGLLQHSFAAVRLRRTRTIYARTLGDNVDV